MNDVVQFQRIASGYVPGLSEHGTPAAATPPASTPQFGSPAPSSAVLENCIVLRPVAAGIYDIIVNANGPAPVGLGGILIASPPLVTPNVPAIICDQARVRIGVRTVLPNAVVAPTTVAANPAVTYSVFNGASLGATPLYTGVDNRQVFRVIFGTFLAQAAGVQILADADFDFSIERVIGNEG